MEDSGFLGTGLKFPLQVNKSTGRFTMSSGGDSVKESVYIILMTAKGERWMSPEFGSNIMSYTFMDTSAAMTNVMRNDLRNLILAQEPRIGDVEIEIDEESRKGCLIISIGYVIRETNTRDNLVFPFYLQAAKEEYDESYEE